MNPSAARASVVSDSSSVAWPLGCLLASLLSQYVGAASAKGLFPLVGAEGVTALRVSIAAVILMAVWRPWRTWPGRRALPDLIAYGAMLGLMNLCIYQAMARIPIGVAIAIEVTGPLAVALFGSRRPRDVLWVVLAVAGLLPLLPVRGATGLDPVGMVWAAAAAACWALYIVFGKRASALPGGQAAAWGMLVATTFTLPLGVAQAGSALLAPGVLLTGLAVAVLSSAAPYSLEMVALRRLPRHVFGLLVSASPAVAALVGFFMLGERLSALQWAAIACVVGASAGSALGAPAPAATATRADNR
ncbi:EamA family transporter [Aquabacterium olei]|uniref:EamA family transporter n=1 Tax=Aquabacterium olei TaxID=1296669 RepID=A0A2U8FN15_9BURK|nr:EamA family transporter [Aquabacterium olei]AWI52441.1 EamA family transporter [Aquabacterium olei]